VTRSIRREISSVAGRSLGLRHSSGWELFSHGSRQLLRCPDDPARLDQLSAKGFVNVRAGVADNTGNVHTPIMTLKNAALLALIGTILMTALLVWNFVSNVLNVLRGVEAPIVLFASFIYAFGCLTVMVFFFVFHRAQS
jgi:hypothetical protein